MGRYHIYSHRLARLQFNNNNNNITSTSLAIFVQVIAHPARSRAAAAMVNSRSITLHEFDAFHGLGVTPSPDAPTETPAVAVRGPEAVATAVAVRKRARRVRVINFTEFKEFPFVKRRVAAYRLARRDVCVEDLEAIQRLCDSRSFFAVSIGKSITLGRAIT